MSKLFATRRSLLIAGITAVLVLASGGAAYAYFTATGSGIGSASVGAGGTWTVAQTGSTSGEIYPGSGSSVITFDVTNDSSGDQQYSSATATINSPNGDNGNITDGGTAVAHCKADWFDATVSSDPDLSQNIAANATVTVTVTVTMPSDSSDDQSACENESPDVKLAIS